MPRLFALLCLLAFAVPASAQPLDAPSIPAAEQRFDSGLRSYQVGQFAAAASSFARAAEDFDYHQRTTAARLMEAKARYAAGDLAGAASALMSFLRDFPRSRYADDARALRRAAQDRLDAVASIPQPTNVGVVLPLADADRPFSQALFNGVRLAVDDHNAAHPDRPVRLVFRDTRGTAEGARRAVTELADQAVVFALGPLYSSEAVAAGEAAERERLTLVAPLATDAAVSEGRSYVFQANPTFERRGQVMARYVAAGGGGPVGVVAQANTMGDTMARAFAVELLQRGGELAFSELLFDAQDWYRLPDVIGDTLADVRALYLPVVGGSAPDHAAAALRGLDQIVFPAGTPRVFGNTEWGQLRASIGRAGTYGTAFTADFHLDESDAVTRAFAERYRTLSGVAPDRLAFAGFDLATYALAALAERRSETSMANTFREARPFAGLGHRIDFDGDAVNGALFILGFRDGELVVLD